MHYGYKNHINADEGNKLIQSYSVTHAAVHESQVFDDLLDQAADAEGNKRAVYADSAYRSEAQEQRLADADIESQVCEKGIRGKPLTEEHMCLAHSRQWVEMWAAPSVCRGPTSRLT
jgi:transposase, IS5 family